MFDLTPTQLDVGAIVQAARLSRLPTDWGLNPPGTTAAWQHHVAAITAESERDWLAQLLPALSPSGAAARRLNAVASRCGVVVTTGQQPGLFGGPLYTWYKALSALALANEIELVTRIPTAAVFWAATDDSDFAEASWTAVSERGGARLLRMPGVAREGAPLTSVPLGDVSGELDAVERAAAPVMHEGFIAALRDSYGGQLSAGSAYVSLLRSVLQPLGIAVLDASHEAVRARSDPLLRTALSRAEAISSALQERTAELRFLGLSPQVQQVHGLSLVFQHADGLRGRVPLPAAARCADRAAAGSLSPNVLLRPVVERFIMPTVAYVGGPSELAYFTQASAVSAALGSRPHLAVPRMSALVVEEHVRRLLQKYGLEHFDLARPHEVHARLARGAISRELLSELALLEEDMRSSFHRIAQLASQGADALLTDDRIVNGARAAVQHRMRRLERRLIAASKRRDAILAEDLATARGALYPLGKQQERALNIVPMLARHGDELLSRLLETAAVGAAQLVGGSQPASSGSLPVAGTEAARSGG